jgi:hypothetical protein
MLAVFSKVVDRAIELARPLSSLRNIIWRGCGKGALEMISRKCFEVIVGYQCLRAGEKAPGGWRLHA